MSLPDNRPLIFVHIPKTAGTTLNTIIGCVYDEDEVYHVYPHEPGRHGLDDFNSLSEERKERIRVYYGYVAFGMHENIHTPTVYATVLRDPIERTISQYYHIKNNSKNLRRTKSEYDKTLARASKMGLEEFISSGILGHLTDNHQVYMLSGNLHEFGRCPEEDLKIAKKNLDERFVLAGLTERFDETVVLLGRALGWPPPYYMTRNVSGERSRTKDLPERVIELITQHNQLDIELYRYATELFDERVREQGPSFAEDVEAFRVSNRYVSRLLAMKYPMIDNLLASKAWKRTAPVRRLIKGIF